VNPLHCKILGTQAYAYNPGKNGTNSHLQFTGKCEQVLQRDVDYAIDLQL